MSVVVLCSVCGEPSGVDQVSCPVCDAREARAVPEETVPPTREERLLAAIDATLGSCEQLRKGRTNERILEASRQRAEALATRLRAQEGVLEAQLRKAETGKSAEASRQTLAKIQRRLAASH